MRKYQQLPLLILAFFLFGSVAVAQDKPAGSEAVHPSVVYKNTFPITIEGGEYTLINMVIDFPTGAGFPPHFHGGHVIVTVLSGEMTLERDGSQTIVKTGEKWTEGPGEAHSVVNKGASARVTATMLLPKGAEETTFVK